MGRYFGREPRLSRQQLELDAQQAIDARVSMGRPPAGDWAPIEARLAEMDRETAARSALPMPVPPATAGPPARPGVADASIAMSIAEVRLPAAAKAGTAQQSGAEAPATEPTRRPVGARPARRPVGVKQR